MYIFNKKVILHIPKTAGTSLKEAILLSDHDVEMTMTHRPLSFLSWPELDFAQDYERVSLIRRPDKWYSSWYNYHLGVKRTCALSNTLLFDDNTRVDINKFIQRASNLTEFFRDDPKRIKEFKLNMRRYPQNHMAFFIPNLSVVNSEYFKNQSLYTFIIGKQIDKTVTVFRFEDQLEEFLEYIKINKLPKNNVTKYKVFPEEASLNLIKSVDHQIYTDYYKD